jgi:hypothetical protein
LAMQRISGDGDVADIKHRDQFAQRANIAPPPLALSAIPRVRRAP